MIDHTADDALVSFLSQLDDFGRHAVADLIVHEYTSEGKGLNHRLDDSIEALEYLETDGEPVPITGHDFLFVGSVG
mgnify:CR=1 FL=1